jgi:hypothetical protein
MNNLEDQEQSEPLLSISSPLSNSIEVVPTTTSKYIWIAGLIIWLAQVGFTIFLLATLYEEEVYRFIFIAGISFTATRTIINLFARGSTKQQHWWNFLCLVVDAAFSLLYLRLWAYPLKGSPGGILFLFTRR